jgi:hypothetical protein
MTRGAECDALRRDRQVWLAGEIRGHQARHIRQHRWLGRFAGERACLNSHCLLPPERMPIALFSPRRAQVRARKSVRKSGRASLGAARGFVIRGRPVPSASPQPCGIGSHSCNLR